MSTDVEAQQPQQPQEKQQRFSLLDAISNDLLEHHDQRTSRLL